MTSSQIGNLFFSDKNVVMVKMKPIKGRCTN